MNAHTKGPWEIIDHNWSDTSIVGNGKTICMIRIDEEDAEENEEIQADIEAINSANARLISAAPDLLAICERMLNHPLIRITGDVEIPLRRAIAKATGVES